MKYHLNKILAPSAVAAMLIFVAALAPLSSADPNPTTYYPYFGASNLGTITSGTTVTLSRLGTLSSYPLTLGTGGTASFTVKLVLSDSSVLAGDKLEIPVTYPASTGTAVLQVMDSGTSGTLLHTSTSTALAGSALLEFVNVTGTAWSYTPKGDVGTRALGSGVQTALQQPLNSSSGLLTGSQISINTSVPGLSAISTGPGQVLISGTPTTTGSAAVSGSSLVSGSAATSGSAAISGSAGQSGFSYSLATATGTLSTQASIYLSPNLSGTSVAGLACVEDLDADQPAGTGTNSVAAGSTVTTWVALTGSNAVASSGTNAPIFQPGLGMYFNGSAVMSIPSVISGTNYCIVIDYTPGLASNAPQLYTGNSQYGQVVWSSTNNVNSGVNCQITGIPGWAGYFGGVTSAQTGEGNTIMTSYDSTGMIYQDGFPSTFYLQSAYGGSGIYANIQNTTMYLGNEGASVGGYNFVGWIRRVRVFSSVPTAAQYAAIFQADAARYKHVASNELIVEGDSIHSITTNNALTKSGLAAYLTGAWDIRTDAYGGKTVSGGAAADDAAFTLMQDIRHPAPVCLVAEGSNDLYAAGAQIGGTNTYLAIVARCQSRRAAGNRIAVETILPRASANEEAQRQICNGLIRANYRQFADAIVDLKDLAPTMDNYSTNFTTVNGANYLTTTGSTQYNSDLTHPTGYGSTLLSQAEATVINAMVPASPMVPVSSTTGQIVVSNTAIGTNATYQAATPGGNLVMSKDGLGNFSLKGSATLSGILVSSEIGNAMAHWWTFDSNLTEDALGSGMLTNNGGLVSSTTGLIGNAALFTGAAGCALYYPESFFMSGTSFSASALFETNSSQSYQFIMGDSSVGGASAGWNVGLISGQVRLDAWNGSTDVTVYGATIGQGTWHRATVTYNSATGVLSNYVDGNPVVTGTLSGTFTDSTATGFYIGGLWYGSLPAGSATYNLTGAVDDVRLFPGVCLSSTAASVLNAFGTANGVVSQNLYLTGTAPAPANSGTAAAWAAVTTGTFTYKLPLYQ